jgi:hypothetical protein
MSATINKSFFMTSILLSFPRRDPLLPIDARSNLVARDAEETRRASPRRQQTLETAEPGAISEAR